MRFYGVGLVCDKERNCVLCRFRSGFLDTDDERVAARLIELGYKYDADIIPALPPEPKEPTEPVRPEPPKPRHRGKPAKRSNRKREAT